MSTAEKKNFIQEHAEKRTKIKKEIAALNKQREMFVKAKRSEMNSDIGMLDLAMIKAIKESKLLPKDLN